MPFFEYFCRTLILLLLFYCRTMCHAARTPRSIHLAVHLLSDVAAVSNFESLRQHIQSNLKHRASILPRVMYKTRFPSFCPFYRAQRFSKWLQLIQWSVPLLCGAVSSCFRKRIPAPTGLHPMYSLPPPSLLLTLDPAGRSVAGVLAAPLSALLY
jgi:hypothetical protein